jgi:peptidoglycan hydrolase-like protein with peptidoglycan-binding domain
MRNFRPALLILLTASVAGLGVPGSFGQTKATSQTHSKQGSAGRSAKSRPSNKRSKGARKQPGQKAPTTDRITEIQTALARDGSFQGPPTGKWDDDTAAAMRRFQASHGLNANGKLDAPTLQRLGLGSQTAGVAAPTPPPGATSRLTSSASAPSATTETARRQ